MRVNKFRNKFLLQASFSPALFDFFSPSLIWSEVLMAPPYKNSCSSKSLSASNILLYSASKFFLKFDKEN